MSANLEQNLQNSTYLACQNLEKSSDERFYLNVLNEDVFSF